MLPASLTGVLTALESERAVVRAAAAEVLAVADAHATRVVPALRDAVRIARERADLPEDAPVLGAIRIPPLARLSRPKNSEDPRTWVGTAWPGLRDVVSALGLTADATLRMPDISLR